MKNVGFSGVYILENLTDWFYQTLVILRKTGKIRHDFGLKSGQKTYEGAELALNRGQIWTQSA